MSEFSRRRLLEGGVASLALAPVLARADSNAPATPPANGAPPAGKAQEMVQGRTDSFHHMTVETFVNGAGPFRFVVDTGADRTVIASNVAAKLGLLNGDQMTVQGIARAVNAPSVQLDKLQVGPIVVDNLRTPVLPRALLGSDGYLGLDVIDGRSVTFDFQKQLLTIDASSAQSGWQVVSSDEFVVRVNGQNGRLMAVNCKVDETRAYAFIDSGAQMSIGNTRLFAELQKHGAGYLSNDVIPVMGVTGGSTGGRLTFVDSIRFGSVRFNNSVLLISDLEVFDVWGLADEPALFIGMNFLQSARAVTIDYGSKRIVFRLADLLVAGRG